MPLNVLTFGAIGDGTADDSAAFNAAILAACPAQPARGMGQLLVPPGSYLLTPGLVHFRDGLRLIGEGERNCELIARTAEPGAILGRPFVPQESANDRIKRVLVAGLRIVLRGAGQCGINLSHCGRSVVEECLISPQTAHDENSNQPRTVFPDSMGVLIDVADARDVGYEGGEVCDVRGCWIEHMRFGVLVMGGHNHRIYRNDIAGGDTPINVYALHGTKGVSIVGNTLQDCTGYALDYWADDGWIAENYFEPGPRARGAILLRGGWLNNRVGQNHFGHGSGNPPVKVNRWTAGELVEAEA